MADPLLEALQNQRQIYQDNNFWGQAGDAMGAISKSYAQNQDPYFNPNGNLLGALLTGVGSGFMKGYGQQEVRRQTQDFANVLRGVAKDYYAGNDISYAYKSPYQALQDAAPALEFGRMQNDYQLQQKIDAKKQEGALDFLNKQREAGLIPIQSTDQSGKSYISGWDVNKDYLIAKGEAAQLSNPSFGSKALDSKYQPIVAKVLAGQDLSPEDAQLVSSAPFDLIKEIRQNNQLNDANSRFAQNLGQRKATKNLFGYDFLTDAQLTDTEAAKLRDKIAQTNVLSSVFNQVATNPNYNPDEIFGNNAALTDALRAAAFQKLRMGAGTGANSGAALNPGEKAIIEDMNFATMATDPIGSLKRMMAGRDQKQFAKDMAGVIQKLQDEEILGYGGIRSGVTPDYYSPEAINKYKTSSGLNDFGKQWLSTVPQQAPAQMAAPERMVTIRSKSGQVKQVKESELAQYGFR